MFNQALLSPSPSSSSSPAIRCCTMKSRFISASVGKRTNSTKTVETQRHAVPATNMALGNVATVLMKIAPYIAGARTCPLLSRRWAVRSLSGKGHMNRTITSGPHSVLQKASQFLFLLSSCKEPTPQSAKRESRRFPEHQIGRTPKMLLRRSRST